MKKEWLVERQGRTFALYAGILALAHEQGLKSIRTELVQIPGEDNSRVAIARAVVVLEKEGIERTFTGIGDAAPSNVAPAMQTCLMRMAETRAKARALRDAVNIGEATFEELGEAEEGAPESGSARGRSGSRSASPVSAGSRSASAKGGNGSGSAGRKATEADTAGLASAAQKQIFAQTAARKGYDALAYAQEQVPGLATLETLTAGDAMRLINALNSPHKSAA